MTQPISSTELRGHGIGRPLILSAIVAALTALAINHSGGPGIPWDQAPWSALARYLTNSWCLFIIVIFLAIAVYALLQLSGTRVDRHLWQTYLDDKPRRNTYLQRLRRWLTGRDADLEQSHFASLLTLIEGHGRTTTREELVDHLMRLRNHDLRERLEPLGFGTWLLPLLGFMGTVIGISSAVAGLDQMLDGGPGGFSQDAMHQVTDGLSYAFDTTLVGLFLVVPLMLLGLWLKVRERRLDVYLQGRFLQLPEATGATDAGKTVADPE